MLKHKTRRENTKEEIPKEIYLQVEDEFYQDTSWCADRINDNDIKYVLDSGWISVKDRLPETDNKVLVYSDHGDHHDIYTGHSFLVCPCCNMKDQKTLDINKT